MCVMLYYIAMARGKSGRIVIEIDPKAKSDIYACLAMDNMTMKEWFEDSVDRYLKKRGQQQLFGDEMMARKQHNSKARK
jgi:predicted thioredoxin/glutaredoxin